MHLSDLRGRSVAIWGTGREGMAAATAVAAHGPAALVAVDDREDFLSLPWEGAVAEAARWSAVRLGWSACSLRTWWSARRECRRPTPGCHSCVSAAC